MMEGSPASKLRAPQPPDDPVNSRTSASPSSARGGERARPFFPATAPQHHRPLGPRALPKPREGVTLNLSEHLLNEIFAEFISDIPKSKISNDVMPSIASLLNSLASIISRKKSQLISDCRQVCDV